MGKSGIDNSQILLGRPHGGVSIIYKKSLTGSIKHVFNPCKRLCAIEYIAKTELKYLIVCAYFPCDKGFTNTRNADHEDVIDNINVLCYSDDYCGVVIAGDLNTSFERNNVQTKSLKLLMDNCKVRCGWDHPRSCKDWTYMNDALGHRSCIDHFLLTANLFEKIISNYVIYDIDNMSCHSPILLTIAEGVSHTNASKHTRVQPPKKCKWYKADKQKLDSYRHLLDVKLSNIRYPVSLCKCDTYTCDNPGHACDIEQLCDDIVICCIESGEETIPQTNSNDTTFKRSVPGWSKYIAPYKESSLFWHWLWKDCGKPNTGQVYATMCHTRRQYHYAIRRVRSAENAIIKEKVAETLQGGRPPTAFWREINKLKPCTTATPDSIDGIYEPMDIADHLASKYKSLYTSVPTNEEELRELRMYLRDMCKHYQHGHDCECVFTEKDFARAKSNLKYNKSDGDHNFMSDHIKHAGPKLDNIIIMLLNSMVKHGYTPTKLLQCNIVSIPKDRTASLTTSDNYRGIALCNAICKLFDILLICKSQKYLHTSELQFAFKPQHSTFLCTAMLIETATHYVYDKSNVFTCLLDASKAFDRVHYGKLFRLLISRGLPAPFTRVLLDGYTRQKVHVLHNGFRSRPFSTENGVKQGGVLSPILFIIYFDELLKKLEANKVGCHIGNTFIGALGYADDVTLLAPSVNALESMIKTCV